MYRALVGGPIGVQAPFGGLCALAEEYGFQGVDVGLGPVKELGLAGVAKLLKDHDLKAALAGMPVNFRDDEATFAQGLADLPCFAETMAELGCTRVATWIKPWHDTLRAPTGSARTC